MSIFLHFIFYSCFFFLFNTVRSYHMKLPSKFITFKESSAGKFGEVLELIQDYDLPLLKLYKKLVKNKTDIKSQIIS